MLTSLTLKYNNREPAFTLIELVIVIFIISLTSALIIPNLWESDKRALRSDAKRIGSTLRYVYDEAVGKKIPYTLHINLNKGSWGFESENETRSFTMRENVVITDVIIPSLGKIRTGEAILPFGPLGPEEPLMIHLSTDEYEYTVIFNNLNGRAKAYEGYRT